MSFRDNIRVSVFVYRVSAIIRQFCVIVYRKMIRTE